MIEVNIITKREEFCKNYDCIVKTKKKCSMIFHVKSSAITYNLRIPQLFYTVDKFEKFN